MQWTSALDKRIGTSPLQFIHIIVCTSTGVLISPEEHESRVSDTNFIHTHIYHNTGIRSIQVKLSLFSVYYLRNRGKTVIQATVLIVLQCPQFQYILQTFLKDKPDIFNVSFFPVCSCCSNLKKETDYIKSVLNKNSHSSAVDFFLVQHPQHLKY